MYKGCVVLNRALIVEEVLFGFLKELEAFEYAMESLDHIWNVLFPSENGKWHHLRVVNYKEAYVFIDITGDLKPIELKKPNSINELPDYRFPDLNGWTNLVQEARSWLKLVAKDWIAANKRVRVEYPLDYRKGIVPHALIRATFADYFRFDLEVGPEKKQKIIELVESLYLRRSENTELESLTANEYFNYCKIAYIAAKREDEKVDETLSGRELYRMFADGRDDGLLEIDGDSQQEFADWIDGKHPKKGMGGHPWEIKRGGNTTHITLAVYRPRYSQHNRFVIELCGEAWTRFAETLKMLYAIHKAGLPITITNPESVRKRLLAQDNVGIIPSYDSYHRANQYFPAKQDVFEVLHYKDLGRYKRRITPFITWEPLPILRPM